MGHVTGRGKAVKDKLVRLEVSARGKELASALLGHFDLIHSTDIRENKELERYLNRLEAESIENDKSNLNFKKGWVTFSPSSSDKCDRELWYKALRVDKEEELLYPYNRRWTRNGSAIHAAVQKDLMYGELMENPAFRVVRTKQGNRPAWERFIRVVKPFTHNGVDFQLYGMMDGVLEYTKDGSKIGFEFKTKSTTLGAIGDYKMKDAQDSHKQQAIAYSLLFGLDEFLICYESLAKDSWGKGEEAKPDMRSFYIKVTDEQRNALLDKWAVVAQQYYDKDLPNPDLERCIFCSYKGRCASDRSREVAANG